MKEFLCFLCLLFMMSCSENRQIRTGLDLAESYLSTAPDSALAVIQGIDGPSLPTRSLRARHALLQTMAQDKCYIDVAEDSTVLVAYDYYQHHGGKRDRLLATYYLGVIRQNAEAYIPAAWAFREAEPLAEALEDYRQLSLIDQHLSRLFAINYDHVRALEYAEKALDAAELAGESLMADYCRLDMANQQMAQKEYSQAADLLRGLLGKGNENSDLYARASLALARTLIYQPGPDFQSAKGMLEEIQRIRKPEQLETNLLYLMSLAMVYENEGHQEQSDKCLEQASSLLNIPIDSAVFYDSKRYILELRRDWDNAYRSLYQAVTIQDGIVSRLLDQSVTHSMEQYFADKWEMERTRSRSRLYLLGFLGMLLFGIIAGLLLLLRKKNKRLLEEMLTIQEVSDDLDQLRKEHAASYELVERFITDKVNSLQRLSESYFTWEDAAVKKRETQQGILTRDDIIRQFRMQLGELRRDQSFIPALEQSLNYTDDGIMDKARQLFKKDNELDCSFLTLLFSGFSIKSISYLLRMSEASLRMRKTRIKQQIETLQEPYRSRFLDKLG